MTFNEWATEYFGKDVDVPEACRDAWNAALEEAAKVCDTAMQEEFAEANNPVRTPFGKDLAKAGGCMAFNLAKDIRARSKTC